MAVDDEAGRRAVREARLPVTAGDSVFTPRPRHTSRPDAPYGVTLRDDVHARALEAARKIVRARQARGSE